MVPGGEERLVVELEQGGFDVGMSEFMVLLIG